MSITGTLISIAKQIALPQGVAYTESCKIFNPLFFSAATSYFEDLEIERYCDEEVPIINIPQTLATKKTNSTKTLSAKTSSANTSTATTSSTVSDTEKIKTIPTANSLKRPRKNGPKEYKRNTVKKFIGKKKKYKNMSEKEILKDFYLNHCGLCRIKFKELDENLKLGTVQNDRLLKWDASSDGHTDKDHREDAL